MILIRHFETLLYWLPPTSAFSNQDEGPSCSCTCCPIENRRLWTWVKTGRTQDPESDSKRLETCPHRPIIRQMCSRTFHLFPVDVSPCLVSRWVLFLFIDGISSLVFVQASPLHFISVRFDMAGYVVHELKNWVQVRVESTRDGKILI